MSFQCPVHEVGWSYMGVCWMPGCTKVATGSPPLPRPPHNSASVEEQAWRDTHGEPTP